MKVISGHMSVKITFFVFYTGRKKIEGINKDVLSNAIDLSQKFVKLPWKISKLSAIGCVSSLS